MNKDKSYESNLFQPGRRGFIATIAAALAATALAVSPLDLLVTQTKKIKAIAFDAFPIFDPRSVFAAVENMFPEKGKKLNDVWRTKQFEYC